MTDNLPEVKEIKSSKDIPLEWSVLTSAHGIGSETAAREWAQKKGMLKVWWLPKQKMAFGYMPKGQRS